MMEDRNFGAIGQPGGGGGVPDRPGGYACWPLPTAAHIVPMVSVHGPQAGLGDGDTGPNTGGMGTIAPNPYYTRRDCRASAWSTIFLPTVDAMQAEGRPFKGCLYFGLMLTPNGPKVIEYNCRFGDPGDPGGAPPAGQRPDGHVLQACVDGTLDQLELSAGKSRAPAWSCWPPAAIRWSTIRRAMPITGLDASGQCPHVRCSTPVTS